MKKDKIKPKEIIKYTIPALVVSFFFIMQKTIQRPKPIEKEQIVSGAKNKNRLLDIPYLNELPIRLPITKKQKQLVKTIIYETRKIVDLKIAYNKFLNIWVNGFRRFGSTERSLYEILKDDAEQIKHGKSENAWTKKATFYPFRKVDNVVDSAKFQVITDYKNAIIEIRGFDKKSAQNLSYEMEFNSRDIMQHVYLSIVSFLRSRSRAKNISELLQKVEVPVVMPDIRSITNVFRKIKSELNEWLRKQKMSLTSDIGYISENILKLDREIDNHIFNLYSLRNNEKKLILEIV